MTTTASPITATPSGRMPVRRILTRALLLLALVAAAVALWVYGRPLLERTEETVEEFTPATTQVAARDLTTSTSADGAVTYANQRDVAHPGTGVVTWTPEVGTIITAGEPLYAVNNEPVVLLPGDRTIERRLSTTSEPGPDIAMLEQSLVALGYDPDVTVTVDEEFTANTALMVERWQADVGQSLTGAVDVGSVVTAPTVVRVADVLVSTRQSLAAGQTVLGISDTNQTVSFSITASDLNTLQRGEVVDLRFQNRSTSSAEVVSLTPVDSDGFSVVTAVPNSDRPWPGDENTSVTVGWTALESYGTLAVPAEAITRVESLGYTVEVVNDDGTTTFVPVELGISDGSFLEVSGAGLAAGTVIVTP